MCGVAEAALAASIGSAVLGAAGQVQQGKAAKANAAAAAAQHEADAQQRLLNAQEDERRTRRRNRRAKARARIAIGSSGLDAAGTPLDVFLDDAQELELDALGVRWAGQVGASRSRNAAEHVRYQGSQAARQANFGALTTLVAGFGRAGMQYGGLPGGSTVEATPAAPALPPLSFYGPGGGL